MTDTSTPMRSAFVTDEDGQIASDWVADDWISPMPRERSKTQSRSAEEFVSKLFRLLVDL
jgi:hypothetical protein